MALPWEWHIDIDHYINPYLFPPPRTFPRDRLLRALGFQDRPRRKIGNIACIFWAFVGTVSALAVITAICRHIPAFQVAGTPLTIGSFGAAAVLEFYAIESPLSQPRNLVLGQLISSVIGVAVNKGFARLPASRYDDLRWLAGALACASSTTATALTGTLHPPGGATALLAVTDSDVAAIGWALVPLVVLSSVIMLGVALLVNNIQREFPAYWWASGEVGSFWTRERPGCEGAKTGRGRSGSSSSDAAVGGGSDEMGCSRLVLTKDGISVPPHVELLPEERECLEALCRRL